VKKSQRGARNKKMDEVEKTAGTGILQGAPVFIWCYTIRAQRGLVQIELSRAKVAIRTAFVCLPLIWLSWHFRRQISLEYVFWPIGILAAWLAAAVIAAFFVERWELREKEARYSLFVGSKKARTVTLEGDLKLLAVISETHSGKRQSTNYDVFICDDSFNPTKLKFYFCNKMQMEQFLKCISDALVCQIKHEDRR
jgi:hypothetical protein